MRAAAVCLPRLLREWSLPRLLPSPTNLPFYPPSAVNGIRETVIGCLFAGRALSRDAKLPIPDTEKDPVDVAEKRCLCLLRGPFHINMSTVPIHNTLASSLLWEAFLITAHTTWGVKILRKCESTCSSDNSNDKLDNCYQVSHYCLQY